MLGTGGVSPIGANLGVVPLGEGHRKGADEADRGRRDRVGARHDPYSPCPCPYGRLHHGRLTWLMGH